VVCQPVIGGHQSFRSFRKTKLHKIPRTRIIPPLRTDRAPKRTGGRHPFREDVAVNFLILRAREGIDPKYHMPSSNQLLHRAAVLSFQKGVQHSLNLYRTTFVLLEKAQRLVNTTAAYHLESKLESKHLFPYLLVRAFTQLLTAFGGFRRTLKCAENRKMGSPSLIFRG
jgi:hypothetical protein